MTINKERIENIEASMGGMQYHISHAEIRLAERMIQLKDTVMRLTESLTLKREGTSSNAANRPAQL